MLKPLLLALLAACGVHSTAEPADQQPVQPPEGDEKPQEDQHFCCKTVDFDGKLGRGEGCVAIGKEHIGSCSKVLYCPGLYTNDEGVVTCPP